MNVTVNRDTDNQKQEARSREQPNNTSSMVAPLTVITGRSTLARQASPPAPHESVVVEVGNIL